MTRLQQTTQNPPFVSRKRCEFTINTRWMAHNISELNSWHEWKAVVMLLGCFGVNIVPQRHKEYCSGISGNFVRPCVTHSKAIRFVPHVRCFHLCMEIFSCWSGLANTWGGATALCSMSIYQWSHFTQSVMDICYGKFLTKEKHSELNCGKRDASNFQNKLYIFRS